jgi:molybdopterin-guanine dinucleotide biosynthesis protein A
MSDGRLPPLWGGILVGGASRRMGSPKALLERDGRAFFERVRGALAPHVEHLVVLGEGPTPPSAQDLPRLADAAGVAGPLAGILGAFDAEARVAWLVAACDLPLLSESAVAWLVAQRSPACVAILPRRRPVGPVEPLCAIYEPAAAAALRDLRHRATTSLQPLAALPGVAVPLLPETLERAWCNVNTPEDLREIRRG